MEGVVLKCALVLCLVSMQLTLSSGGLMCFMQKHGACQGKALKEAGKNYCSVEDKLVDCIQENARKCNVSNSPAVHDMEKRVTEICQEGTELNKDLKKHMPCVMESQGSKYSQICNEDFENAIRSFPFTEDYEADTIKVLSLACREGFIESANKCTEQNVRDLCDEEAVLFHRQLNGPSHKMNQLACKENAAAESSPHEKKVHYAVGKGTLMCFINRFTPCSGLVLRRADNHFCSVTDDVVDCIKDSAVKCDVTESELVKDLEKRHRDLCREGSEQNKVYKKHIACLLEHNDNMDPSTCSKDYRKAIKDFPVTKDSERDRLELLKISCKYIDEISKCGNQRAVDACGEEAGKLQHLMSGASEDILKQACMEMAKDSPKESPTEKLSHKQKRHSEL